eukprot:3522976-Pleurochrysis_carterae.AAC.1
MSPAAAAKSCAAARGRTPSSPSLSLKPTMRACDARRLDALSSPRVRTSHSRRSSCGPLGAASALVPVAPVSGSRSGTHCKFSATITACRGYSSGSPLLMDRATAARSVLPFTGVNIFAGQFCERSEGAAAPCLLPCDRTPCSTP